MKNNEYYAVIDRAMQGDIKARAIMEKQIGRKIKNLGDIHAEQTRVFALFTPAEKKADLVETEKQLRKAAVIFGQRGGQATSKAKAAASRENGKKGGRPRKNEK